jgi:hypothetical protein
MGSDSSWAPPRPSQEPESSGGPELEPSRGRPPRLLDQLHQALRLRHRSTRTEEAYVDWVKRFILFHGKRHPRELGSEEITEFLNHLATQRQVTPSTQNQAARRHRLLVPEGPRVRCGRAGRARARAKVSTPPRRPDAEGSPGAPRRALRNPPPGGVAPIRLRPLPARGASAAGEGHRLRAP